MSSPLLRARANTAFQILKEAIPAVLEEKIPADSFLARKFKLNKQFGSRDRRFIRDIVFVWFRWRGLILEHLPEEPEPSPRGILCALLADGAPADLLEMWADWGGLAPETVFAAAEGDSLPEKIHRFTGKPVDPLCVLPEWSREKLDPRFAEWYQKRPTLWLRANCGDLRERLAENGIEITPHETIRNAYRCENRDVNLYQLPEYRDGLFEVQDFSSQCIGLAASPSAGEIWLDSCAGAGGKTLQLLSMLNGKGRVVSSDVSERRMEELGKRVSRCGWKVSTEVHDLTQPLPKRLWGRFDGVLTDAPCSSSGRWRRNPELRWQSSPEQVRKYSELQMKILENVSKAVKPGGYLIYATCSAFPEENEKQIENFLNFHFDFELDEKWCILPNSKMSGMLRVSPWDADCDASFAARLRRKELPEDALPPQP